MTPIRTVAILGLGNQGRHHATAAIRLLRDRKLDHVVLCDSDVARLGPYRGLEDVTVEVDAQKIIDSRECQAVIVAVPNLLHESLTLEALKAGCHVLKEKPLGISLESAHRMDAIARASGTCLEVVQQRFHHPGFAAAAKAILRIGTVRFADYHFSLLDERLSWYWSKRHGGGAWLGIGWHICNVLCSIFGTPRKVRAHFFSGKETSWNYDTEDSVIGEIHFDNLIARFSASVVGGSKHESLLMEGSSGFVRLDRNKLLISVGNMNAGQDEFGAFDWSTAYSSLLEDFLARATVGSAGASDLDLLTMAVMEAGRQSADMAGEVVDIGDASAKLNAERFRSAAA